MRIRQHVNPLSRRFLEISPSLPALDPSKTLEVEVGCADAQFLFERARIEPNHQYIGLEIREAFVEDINRRARAENLPIHGVFCSANHHLKKLFANRKIDVAYLNFPDPWFKRRHFKRRMITEELIADIATVMKPGGKLLFQTDVESVATPVMRYLTGNSDFENEAGAGNFLAGRHAFNARSWRESNCEANDMPIWRVLLTRN